MARAEGLGGKLVGVEVEAVAHSRGFPPMGGRQTLDHFHFA